ncbi:saccharopine dehydrogenase family protein [Saccharothrix obliqua]|uniref:saccharopine dehydrogenase family protein n=1 Tax=Saccharothrix obliqua TaxID=2861747 RepID=UPI001C5E88A1|nr:saccharopine dehydrogenase NADP-binding domain-containing protein [Saccharothrix obliqua]MBW4716906.1 saccharopine dehydrogenase NADP-binding domain-containing protein [Saccharothrix obliqua]
MYDVVLFGATGFTGELTAAYLAEHAPAGTRWAVAGRNRAKLEALRERLGVDVDLLTADVTDGRSLMALAESARVVATTAGPYVEHGDGLVGACARAGADYVDLAGEPEFVDRAYLRHHAAAQATGARLVHSCGFESVPHDLGVLLTVRRLPEGVPIAVDGYVRAAGALSGGTFQSAVTAFARWPAATRVARQRRRVEGSPAGRVVRAGAGRPGYDRRIGAWALPAPTIDPRVVSRSAAALDRYGPEFTYAHHIAVRRLPTALGIAGGVGALFAAARVPPVRERLSALRPPGAGPSAEQRARSWFEVVFFGTGGGRRVVTEVSGGDPGYGETAKMLGESALCLAFDHLPETAGQVTPAVAMGDALTSRLVRAGIRFDVRG